MDRLYIASIDVKKVKLEVHGRARREAARRRKSECKVNLGNRKSSRSNSLWQMANDYTKTVSQIATVANGTASAYSVRALRVGQYVRYKHWPARRPAHCLLLVADPISGLPTLARKVGLLPK